MRFEWPYRQRRLGKKRADCRQASQPVFVTGLSGASQLGGRRRRHTCSGDVRVGADVVMRKIVSWLLREGNRRRPQSKFNGAEPFDEHHRAPAYLGRCVPFWTPIGLQKEGLRTSLIRKSLKALVGPPRFELGTSCTPIRACRKWQDAYFQILANQADGARPLSLVDIC
jgi:hypothetical protein